MRFLTPSLLTLAGLLLAAQGDAIVRIDPLTGRREPVARINREDPGADGLPLQIDALAVAPDGSLVVSDRGLFEEQGGRILRLEAGGRVTTLAGNDTHDLWYSGDRKDAREADFALNGLAEAGVAPGWLCEIPFKPLCRSGELRPHLPEDLRLHIGS
jgi:hypothetical protein